MIYLTLRSIADALRLRIAHALTSPATKRLLVEFVQGEIELEFDRVFGSAEAPPLIPFNDNAVEQVKSAIRTGMARANASGIVGFPAVVHGQILRVQSAPVEGTQLTGTITL